jgi:hypothetical protein|nr:MAG TPA: hypothetical protein [Bacteriophage sp.]
MAKKMTAEKWERKDISMKKQCDTITLNGGDGKWQK